MFALSITVFLSLIVSFICSMTEACIYSIPYVYTQHLAGMGSRAGKILSKYKEDMTSPVTAILLLNTIANTAGAALVGYLAADIFTEMQLVIFSVFFTLAVLYIGEIIPKIIGVTYNKELAPILVYGLSASIVVLKPLIIFSVMIKKLFKTKDEPSFSTQEILSMTEIGEKEGSLDALESEIITNTIGLDQMLVGEVQTPRIVVFRLQSDVKLGEIREEIKNWNFTRVPLYEEESPEVLSLYVHQKDLYQALLSNQDEQPLKDFARKLKTVPELMRVDRLLTEISGDREPIRAVVDEHGALSGIITLEDILEEIIGSEIVDEYDKVENLRRHARRQARVRRSSLNGNDKK